MCRLEASQSTAHSRKHRFDTGTRAGVWFICSRGAARVVNCGRVRSNQRDRRNARGDNKPVDAIQRGPRWIALLRACTCEVFSLRGTATR